MTEFEPYLQVAAVQIKLGNLVFFQELDQFFQVLDIFWFHSSLVLPTLE